MPERNIELLQKTMQYIKDHPEQHNQDHYWDACGTPSCFAGWALHLHGVTEKQVYASGYSTRGYANSVLGITSEESLVLFLPGNTLPMLELMVKDLTNGDKLRRWCEYRKEEARNA